MLLTSRTEGVIDSLQHTTPIGGVQQFQSDMTRVIGEIKSATDVLLGDVPGTAAAAPQATTCLIAAADVTKIADKLNQISGIFTGLSTTLPQAIAAIPDGKSDSIIL
jgi:hypothetical protein